MIRLAPLAVLLAGCGPAPLPDYDGPRFEAYCDEGPPVVDLGADALPFSAYRRDPEIEQVHGPQGGYHIQFAIRPGGLSVRGWVEAELQASSRGVELAWAHRDLVFECQPKTGRVLHARGILYLPEEQPSGTPVALRVRLVDPAGVEASTSVRGVLGRAR